MMAFCWRMCPSRGRGGGGWAGISLKEIVVVQESGEIFPSAKFSSASGDEHKSGVSFRKGGGGSDDEMTKGENV